MKKIAAIACYVAMISLSCDEAFDPHGEFVERPVLYCVMKAPAYGSSSQRAILTRTVPGRELLSSPGGFSSPFITGAVVMLHLDNDVRLMELLDTANIGTPEQVVQLTYGARAVLLKPGASTSIRASLPDGRILTASTSVPPYLYFELSYRFPHGFTTAVNPLTRGSVWTFSWDAPEGLLHIPELSLTYSVLRPDSSTDHRVLQIPQRLRSFTGSEMPIYPQPTYERSCGFEFAAIDSAFARCARTEGDFLLLTIDFLRFSVVTYDVPLGQFYTSVNGSLDPYSIRVDETVYSNINGGLGIFGTYIESTLDMDVDGDYVRSFGYVQN